ETHRAVVLFVQLIEPDRRFRRIHRVVDANRNRNQRKPDVAFPNRPHNSPRFEMFRFDRLIIFSSIFAFIYSTWSMKLASQHSYHSQTRSQPKDSESTKSSRLKLLFFCICA